jgi:hypothetical protein
MSLHPLGKQDSPPIEEYSPPEVDRRQRVPTFDDDFLKPFDDEPWDVFLPDDELEPLPDLGDLWWDTSPGDGD